MDIYNSDDFDKLDRTVLQAYHSKHYISDNCTIIVSGKVNDGTLSLINKYLGDAGWKEIRKVFPHYLR